MARWRSVASCGRLAGQESVHPMPRRVAQVQASRIGTSTPLQTRLTNRLAEPSRFLHVQRGCAGRVVVTCPPDGRAMKHRLRTTPKSIERPAKRKLRGASWPCGRACRNRAEWLQRSRRRSRRARRVRAHGDRAAARTGKPAVTLTGEVQPAFAPISRSASADA